MKFLIVVALFAVARAELFESLFRDEIDAAVNAVQYAEHSHISVRDLEDEDREQLIREIKTDIGKTLAEKLEATTQKLIDAITKGKASLLTLFGSFRQLVKDLKEAGGNAGEYIKKAVDELKIKINTLDTDHLTPAVKLIFEFVKKFTNRDRRELDDFDSIEDEVVGEVVVRTLQRRGIIKDMFTGVINTGKGIVNKLLVGLEGRFKEYAEVITGLTKEHLEAAKPNIDNLKGIAEEFVKHAQEVTKESFSESLEFIGNYINHLDDFGKELKGVMTNFLNA